MSGRYTPITFYETALVPRYPRSVTVFRAWKHGVWRYPWSKRDMHLIAPDALVFDPAVLSPRYFAACVKRARSSEFLMEHRRGRR
jgi:hypothetical protein